MGPLACSHCLPAGATPAHHGRCADTFHLRNTFTSMRNELSKPPRSYWITSAIDSIPPQVPRTPRPLPRWHPEEQPPANNSSCGCHRKKIEPFIEPSVLFYLVCALGGEKSQLGLYELAVFHGPSTLDSRCTRFQLASAGNVLSKHRDLCRRSIMRGVEVEVESPGKAEVWSQSTSTHTCCTAKKHIL